MDIQKLEPEHLTGILLGALIDKHGGLVELDIYQLEKILEEKFYAVKIEFVGDKLVLEVIHDESAAQASFGEDSN